MRNVRATDQSYDEFRGGVFSGFKNVTALITGANGFIGTGLTRAASECFGHVISVNRAITRESRDNVTEAAIDVSCRSDVFALIENYKPQIVFHLAGMSSAVQGREMIRDTFNANAAGTVHMLDAAVENSVAKFIYSASMEEPMADRAAAPNSPYAASKFVGSVYARMCSHIYDIDSVIARPYFVYGPGQTRAEKLVPYLIHSLLSGKSPQLASGSREMDWVFVQDVVSAFMRASVTELPGGIEVPIGSGQLTSIRNVAERIAVLCNSGAKPEFGAETERLYEVSPVADVNACEKLLGWVPATSLDDGLKQTVQWYKSNSFSANDQD